MSNASDFIIENGVLKKYVGHAISVSVPEGVHCIQCEAFFHNEELLLLQKFVLPFTSGYS